MAAKYRTGTGAMNLDTKGRKNVFVKTKASNTLLAKREQWRAGINAY